MTSRLLTWNEDALGAKTWNHIIPADQIRDNLLPSVRKKVESGLRSGALMTEFSRADIDAMSDAERRIVDVIDFKFYYNETRPDRAAKTEAAFAASGNAFAYFRQFVVTVAQRIKDTDSLPKTQADWADKFHNFIDTHKTALNLEDRIQAVAMQNGLMCQACANELAFPKNARPVTVDEQNLANIDIHDKAKLARRKERYEKWVDKAKNKKLSTEDLERIKSPLIEYINTNRSVTADEKRVMGVKQGLLGAAVGIGGAILTAPAIGAVAGAALIGGAIGYFSKSEAEPKHTCGIYGGDKKDMPNITNYLENRDQFTDVVRHLDRKDLGDETLPEYKKLEDWQKSANEAALCVSIRYLYNVAKISREIREKCKKALPRYLRSYNNDKAAASETKFAHDNLLNDIGAVIKMASEGLLIKLDPTVDVFTPQLAYSLLVSMQAADAPAATSWGTSDDWANIEKSLMDSNMAGQATSKPEACMMAIVFSQLNFESGRVSDRDIDATIDQLQATGTRYLSVIINAVRALNIVVDSALESMLCGVGAFREEKYGDKKLAFGGKELRYSRAENHKIACTADTAVGADPNYLGRGRRRVCVTDQKVCDNDLYQRVDRKNEPRSVFDIVLSARELLELAKSWLTTGVKLEPISYAASAYRLRSQLLSTSSAYRVHVAAGKSVTIGVVAGADEKCPHTVESPVKAFRAVDVFFYRILNAMGGDAKRANKKIIKDDKVEASFYTPEFTKYLLDMVLAKIDNDTDAAASAVKAEETVDEGDATAAVVMAATIPKSWKERFMAITDWNENEPKLWDTEKDRVIQLVKSLVVFNIEYEWQDEHGKSVEDGHQGKLPIGNEFSEEHLKELKMYDGNTSEIGESEDV